MMTILAGIAPIMLIILCLLAWIYLLADGANNERNEND